MNRRKFMNVCFTSTLLLHLLMLAPSGVSLASEEQELRAKWAAMPKEKQELLLQRWKTFQSLSPEEQGKLWGALARFKGLSPETQKRIEQNYERWKKYTPEQKAEVRKNFAEFKALSDQEKESMRDKAKNLDTGSAK